MSELLTLEERDRRWQKVREQMEKQGLDCLIVWGCFGRFRHFSANIAYLSRLTQEGYIVFPLEGDPTLITFLGGPFYYNPWIADNRTGHPKYSKIISDRLRELHLEKARIGIVEPSRYDFEVGFPHNTYVALTNNFPEAKFEDATDILVEIRMIKSPEEVRCLELGCEAGEKAMQAIVDTAKPGVRDYEIRAVIWDTMFREGCEPGSMLLHFSGKDIVTCGQGGMLPTGGPRALEKGDVIEIEVDASYLGYKAQFNQPFSLGETDKEWQDVFNILTESFTNGFNTLKPGITVGELHEALSAPVKKAGYLHRSPTFHGLGLAIEEPFGVFVAQPDYQPNLARIIEPGMVLELEPPAIRPDFKKGATIGSPVLVTDTGCRLLSKEWKPEVRIIK